MALAGSRRHLWRSLQAPRGRDEHPRSHLSTVESLAESVRRATDRIDSARMSGPRHRPRRAPSAMSADRVSHLLSWGANTSGLGEGRADATTRSDADGRARGRVPGSGWITSSLRTTRRVIGTVDRRLGVDAVYVFARSGPFMRVPRRFDAIVFVTASAQDVSAVSRDGLPGRVRDNDQQP